MTDLRILAIARRRFLRQVPGISKTDAAALAKDYLRVVKKNNGRV